MTNFRANLLDWAKSQVGPGDRVAYWLSAAGRDPGKSKSWCVAFCLAGLHHVGLARDFLMSLDGSGMCGPLGLQPTRTPARGDILYDDQPYQHHALFDREHDGWYYSIDGNQGPPAPVIERRRRRAEFTHIYSIEALIRALDTIPAPPRRSLRWSMEGDDVRELQQLLNGLGHALVTDGKFGRITEMAVRSFQRRAGLEADGVVGPKTWAALTIEDTAWVKP